MMQPEVININKQIALEMLRHNTQNRDVDNKLITTYARQMKEGLWEENGESICFGEDGTLKDGQHRLMAIVRADVSVPTVVVRNVKDAVTLYDDHKKRTMNNQMQIKEQRSISNIMSSVVSACLIGFTNSNCVGQLEIINYYAKHSADLDTAMSYALKGQRSPIMRKAGATLAVYAAVRLDLLKTGALSDFCEMVNTGLPVGNAIFEPSLTLRKIIMVERGWGTLSGRKRLFEITWQMIDDFAHGIRTRRKPSKLQDGNEILNRIKTLDEIQN